MSNVHKIIRAVWEAKTISGVSGAMEYAGKLLRLAPDVWRTRNLQIVDRSMGPQMRRFLAPGASVVMHGAFFGAARELYARKVYFAAPDFALHPGDTVVDLGANCGVFSLMAARLGCRVFAVDAQNEFLQILRQLADANGVAQQIQCTWGVLAPEGGLFGQPGELARYNQGMIPEVTTIPELFSKYRIDHVDFLKIDIEGAEFCLFASAPEWLASVRKIAMEVHPRFGSVLSLTATLQERGFSTLVRDDEQRVVAVDSPQASYVFAWRSTGAQVSMGAPAKSGGMQ